MLGLRSLHILLPMSFGLGAALGCSVVFAPDDAVQRCGNVQDCDDPANPRYEAACKFAPGSGLDSADYDQVCLAQFRSISCAPSDYSRLTVNGQPHPFFAMSEARMPADYIGRCVDTMGAIGCPPPSGQGCNQGLVVDPVSGLCDDQDPATPPAIAAADMPEDQDVKDQFCRQVFCNADFVCDGDVCAPCDPTRPFGQGGCGTVYIAGAPSCVYQDAQTITETGCRTDLGEAQELTDAVTFGACG